MGHDALLVGTLPDWFYYYFELFTRGLDDLANVDDGGASSGKKNSSCGDDFFRGRFVLASFCGDTSLREPFGVAGNAAFIAVEVSKRFGTENG